MTAREKEPSGGAQKLFLITGLLLFASEIWKQLCLTFLLYDGVFQLCFLPFQLCSVPMYLCILLGIGWEHARLRDGILCFLADFTLLSGAIVLLDTSGMYYGYAPLTIHSFLWHFVLVLTGIFAGRLLRRQSPGTFLLACGIYLGCCGIAEVLNLTLDRFGIINMFYINPHYEMIQIGFCDLREIIGNTAVILFYILMTVLGAYLLHRIWNRLYKEA